MSISKGASRAANGAGSLRKKVTAKNGKEYAYWEGRVTIGFNPRTGKQVQKTVTGKSQRDVTMRMQKIANEVNQGTYVAPTKLTMAEWLNVWATDYLGDVKASTAELYRWSIKKYIIPGLGNLRLTSLTAPAIQSFYNDLSRREKPLSGKTVKNIHGILHRALQQAVLVGYIRTNPADACKLPRIMKKQMQPLDEVAISTFLTAIQGHPHEYLYKIALFTGLREGELLGLTWDCIDFECGILYVTKQLQREKIKGGKYYISDTKNRRFRTLALAPSVLQLFQLQRAKQLDMQSQAKELWMDQNLVFTNVIGGYLSYRTVYDCFKRIMRRIGTPDTRFHDLRHTYATLSIKGGDDIKTVQENLGHATAAFTLDVYGHVTTEMQRASAKRMEEMIQTLTK